MNDLELVQQCLQKTESAWQEFYTRFIGLIKTIVRRKLGAIVRDLDDKVQDVFLAIIASLDKYDPEYPLIRYVALIAERTCIQEFRKTTTMKRAAITSRIATHDDLEEDSSFAVSSEALQDEKFENLSLMDLLQREMLLLSEKCRELLRLRYYEECSFKEIGEKRNSSENTVTVQTRRCLDELKARINS